MDKCGEMEGKKTNVKEFEELQPEIETASLRKLQLDAESKESSINDLPTEMLLKILNCLNTKTLWICRLVSRYWNSMACEALGSISSLQMEMQLYGEDKKTLQRRNRNRKKYEMEKERSLKDFISCFNKSNSNWLNLPFPYTRFTFHLVGGSTFSHQVWTEFISAFEGNVKCLKLILRPILNDEDSLELIEGLRLLLLHQLPKLKEFGLKFNRCCRMNHEISLFSTPSQKLKLNYKTPPEFYLNWSSEEESEEESEETKETASAPFQLAHLKTIYFEESQFFRHKAIFTDLLVASVNLEKIQPFDTFLYTPFLEIFRSFQSLGKLECLQTARIFIASNETSYTCKISGSTPLNFKLNHFSLTNHKRGNLFPQDSVFLSNLLESSKNSLRKLTTSPLELLKDLQIPIFSKLTSLSINGYEKIKVLPPGKTLLEVFPALQNLELRILWNDFWTLPDDEKSVSVCLPNLRTLKITSSEMDADLIARISKVCPNLTGFSISCESRPLKNFPDVGRAIFRHMEKLQSLSFYVDVSSPANSFPAIDSCITGFGGEDCERLFDLVQADKLLRKRGSQAKIPQSELTARRNNPSILDLKDLRELRIRLEGWYSAENFPGLDVTLKAQTCVSEECALKLMDQLVYRIEQDTHFTGCLSIPSKHSLNVRNNGEIP